MTLWRQTLYYSKCGFIINHLPCTVYVPYPQPIKAAWYSSCHALFRPAQNLIYSDCPEWIKQFSRCLWKYSVVRLWKHKETNNHISQSFFSTVQSKKSLYCRMAIFVILIKINLDRCIILYYYIKISLYSNIRVCSCQD